MVKVGIIGGSGLDDPLLLEDYQELEVETEYGKPSSSVICGKISGVEVCILARHGRKHEIPPSQINYRANIMALKKLGCTHILATGAVGSLKEEIKPGDLIFPDQFLDFTKNRELTFFNEIGEGKVQHTGMSEPFSAELRELLIEEAEKQGHIIHKQATLVVIEGPRFSTKAESNFFRQYADIIGMTAVPECSLAKEQGIEYATIAMSTDYDCWREGEAPVTWEIVKQRMKENSDKVRKLLFGVIPKISKGEFKINEEDKQFIKSKIRTIPNWPRLGVMFRDITTLLKDAKAMKKVIEILALRYKDKGIQVVAGIESRGFIIGGILAEKLGASFVPLRKPGKLPAEKIREEYFLEYGRDAIEVHKDAISSGDKVLIVDDLIATSGTMLGACNLVKKLGGEIVECVSIIELGDLGGRKRLEEKGHRVFSIIRFNENES